MAFSVTEFRGAMTGDGARPNLFEIQIGFPTVVATGKNDFQFFAKSGQLPGSTIGTVNLSYFGRELKFPGNRTFPDWTITVINDEDFKIRNNLEKWMNQINSHINNTRAGTNFLKNENGYGVDAKVYQYGKIGGPAIQTYNFIGLFPIDISPIELDWGTNDSIEEFTVTFAYQWWENEKSVGVSGTKQ